MGLPRRAEPRRERATDPSAPTAAIHERRLRSLAEPLDVRLRASDPYPRLEVRNPVHRTRYLTLLPGFPDRQPALCTCTDFARRGLGDCKHIEAAWHWLTTRPAGDRATTPDREGPSPSEVWERVDRRLEAPPPLEERDIRALASPGSTFFETEASAQGTERKG